MGADFEPAFPVLFDVAIRRLADSGLVVVREPEHSCLYGHKEIASLDGACFTQAGRIVPWVLARVRSEDENNRDPDARVFFMKCGAPTRLEAWRFLCLIGKVLGVEILTEFGEPLSRPGMTGEGDGWSVQYELSLSDDEVEIARREVCEEFQRSEKT
jgi:hypothetical protein